MRLGWIAATGLAVVVLASVAQAPKTVKVKIMSSAGKEVGTATLKAVKTGVQVKISVHDFMLGEHGVHFHEHAVCEGPDFKTAGGHFNPDMKKHGFENPEGHHNGDTPQNLVVKEGNMAEETFVMTSISLDPAAPNSVFANGGTSIVIHEKADDMKTDPSGNSGNRIACGVVK
jgi:superoxide dismutase, Cu-Zn family